MIAEFLQSNLLQNLAFFLATYLLHSTLMLGGVLLAVRFRLLQSNGLKDLLLKTALVGSFVTAVFQFTLGTNSILGKWEMSLLNPMQQDETELIVEMEGEAEHVVNGEPSFVPSPTSSPIIWVQVDSVKKKIAKTADPVVIVNAIPGSQTLKATANANVSAAISAALLLWFLGVLMLFLRRTRRKNLFSGQLLERREIVRGALPQFLLRVCDRNKIFKNIRLTSSAKITSPIAVNMREICFPEQAFEKLETAQQQSMLAHEIAHIVRRDPVWIQIYAFFEIALFFQPLNRIARREWQETAEFLCDDWAVRATGESLNLAKCLAEVASWLKNQPLAVPVAGMAELRSPLIRRVQRLLNNTSGGVKDLPKPMRLILSAGLILLGFGFAPSLTKSPESVQGEDRKLRRSTVVDTHDDVRYKIQIDWDETFEDRALKYKARGKFVFSEDDREIASISRGGFLRLEEERSGVHRSIEVRPGNGQNLDFKYFKNKARAEFDDAAKIWYQAMLLEFIREANIHGAHIRAKRIFEREGLDALKQEIESIRQVKLKESYLRELDKIMKNNLEQPEN